jgi:hypothetical protein
MNLLSTIINAYFRKIFYTNYNIILTKINYSLFSSLMLYYLNQLYKTINFEIIRADFIQEFMHVSILSFYSKDPKPIGR